jgi:hypothetical protein
VRGAGARSYACRLGGDHQYGTRLLLPAFRVHPGRLRRSNTTTGAGGPGHRLGAGPYLPLRDGGRGNIQIFDVWESMEQFEKFGETMLPIMSKLGADPGEPQVATITTCRTADRGCSPQVREPGTSVPGSRLP